MSEVICPQCKKSDMIVRTVQAGMKGDVVVYDCDRCEREVSCDEVNGTTGS